MAQHDIRRFCSIAGWSLIGGSTRIATKQAMLPPDSIVLFSLGLFNITIPRLVLAVGILMLLVELAQPGRRWPKVVGWWTRALLLNCCQIAIVYLAGFLWDGWMAHHRLWSADGLGVAGGAVVGYLVITFLYYWWHYWRHRSPVLWRWFHQVHHSPQRIEVITSFYKHPLELIANGALSSAVLYLIVGLGPAAASQAVLLSGLAELFYHWNVRTPTGSASSSSGPKVTAQGHRRGHRRIACAESFFRGQRFGNLLHPLFFGMEKKIRRGALGRAHPGGLYPVGRPV
jgi:sterol desaturase/sphingolipid hydroxylase (fatty acid hydroxylase superfamily)